MKKDGFTLVELLAVIAVLAILVAIVMPNVMKEYNKAKADVFVIDAQSFVNSAMSKFTNDALIQSGKTMYYSNIYNSDLDTRTLDIDSDKNYFIEMDRNGNIKRFVLYDNTYCYDIFTTYGGDSIGNLEGTKSVNNNGNPIKKESINVNDVWESGNDIVNPIIVKNNGIIESYFVKGCEAKEHSFDDNIKSETNEMTLYSVLENEGKNGDIAKKYLGEHKDSYTKSASYDIYHYYADDDTEASQILNKNNVLFANYCWQMIRTTDTGGVRLLYNGQADNNGQCGLDRKYAIGKIGSTSKGVYSTYYFGSSYTFDESSGLFTLVDVKKPTYKITSDFKGKYSCLSSSSTGTCSSLYRLDSIDYTDAVFSIFGLSHYSQIDVSEFASSNSVNNLGYMTGDKYSNMVLGSKKTDAYPYYSSFYGSDPNKKIAISKTRDGNKLVDPVVVLLDDIRANYAAYEDYKYTCFNEETVCADGKIKRVSFDKTSYSLTNIYNFASDVEYVAGKYKLIDIVDSEGTRSTESISSHRYFCPGAMNECENVGYLYYAYSVSCSEDSYLPGYSCSDNLTDVSTKKYAFMLKDGETKLDLYNNIFNKNVSDSNVKSIVDNWYENNLVSYTDYLEDSVFCASKESSSNSFLNNNVYKKHVFRNNGSLLCESENGMYSVSNNNAKLKYPIGLANVNELTLLGNDSLINTGNSYWVNGLSYYEHLYYPDDKFFVGNYAISNTGTKVVKDITSSNGIRPMISLKAGVKFKSGDGSTSNPYVVK